ncbi:MAG TPA: hypothetical protein VD969_13740 [Symbiobacteriaceae bacterium]|nr:hypothetical protein [Symbiobacteriaceae bacterium]
MARNCRCWRFPAWRLPGASGRSGRGWRMRRRTCALPEAGVQQGLHVRDAESLQRATRFILA